MRPTRTGPIAALLVLAVPALATPVRLVARTLDHVGVSVDFPAVAYDPPADAGGDPAVVCARMSNAADCEHEVPLGVDVGFYRGTSWWSGAADVVVIDW